MFLLKPIFVFCTVALIFTRKAGAQILHEEEIVLPLDEDEDDIYESVDSDIIDTELFLKCLSGYEYDAEMGDCEDLDECILDNEICGSIGASCENIEGSFICVCSTGFVVGESGLCEAISDCHDGINGGCDQICGYDYNGEVVCDCAAGYTLGDDDRTCIDTDECLINNGGCESICVNLPQGSWTCECNEGYRVRSDYWKGCEPVCRRPCKNNGYCSAPDVCTCPAGYHGPGCTALCTPRCANGGICMRANLCRCQAGWTGRDCTTATCVKTCKNGGRCARPNICECPDRFRGRYCEIPECTPECANGGSCIAVDKCVCTTGWGGQRCNKNLNAGLCNPACINGGSCVRRNTCECPRNHTGRYCQHEKTVKCRPPCRNGGKCVGSNGKPTCSCPEGTEGRRCQSVVCPLVTSRVPYRRVVRKPVEQTYLTSCGSRGRRQCIAKRWIHKAVEVTSLKVQYEFNCSGKSGRRRINT